MGYDRAEKQPVNAPAPSEGGQQYGIPLAYVDNYTGVEYNRRCMDVAFAIGFIVFCIALAGLGVFGQVQVSSQCSSAGPPVPGPVDPTPTPYSPSLPAKGWGDSDCGDILDIGCQVKYMGEDSGIIAGCVIVSCLFAFLWMFLLRRYPKPMIYGSMSISVLVWAALGVFFFIMGSWVSGIIFVAFSLLYILYMILLRRRIAFTAILLTEASHGIGSNILLVVFVAPVIVVASAAYLAFFVWTSYTQIKLAYDCNSKQNNIMWTIFWFVNVFGLYWVSNVIMGVYNVTIAGTISNWYFTHGQSGQSVGACMAFGWATTKNFGSICLGSLILAIIEFCRFLLRMAESSNNGYVRIVACCLRCLCWIIQSIIEYITRYAYIYIGMYSTSFISSAKQVFNLFGRGGWQALVNDVVVRPVTFIGTLIGIILGGGACALIVWAAFPNDTFHLFSVICAAVICAVIWAQLSSILLTSVDTIFVCYMEDLERNIQNRNYAASPTLLAAMSGHPKTPAQYKNLAM